MKSTSSVLELSRTNASPNSLTAANEHRSHDSPAERETVITWSDADEGKAIIYTCQPPMMRVLRKHPHARLAEEYRSETGKVTGAEFEIPVACLAIPLRPRSSAWRGLVRAGRGCKGVRGSKSPLSGTQRGQRDPSNETSRGDQR